MSPARRALIATVAACAGCGDVGALAPAPPADGLRVATPWPREERARLAKAFAAWLRDHPGEGIEAVAIAWVEAADDEPVPRASRRLDPRPDVLLGGDVGDYARLAADGRLEGLSDGAPRPYWIVARTEAMDLEDGPGRIALADPRQDAATLAWCLGRVDAEGWRPGYAGLLAAYGEAEPVGWRPSSARAAVASGRADRTIAAFDRPRANYEEGAAVVMGTKRPRAARAFLKFLEVTRGRSGPKFEAASRAGTLATERDLAADLLGATLVDAQEELGMAAAAVRSAGSPAWAVERLKQPPPWPPASVEKLLAKPGEDGPALVDSLTAQVAPDPGAREWLARSWLGPRRDLDRPALAEIAAAEGGRLASEPRFRAWLKAEWTQWARQRYRWVARLAASKPPPSAP